MRFEVIAFARFFDSRTRLIAGPAGLRFEARRLGSVPLSVPLAPLRQLILFPSGSIAIYWETATALGLRER